MSFSVTHDAADPVNNKFYVTQLTSIGAGDGAVVAPGRSAAFSGAGVHKALSYSGSAGAGTVGVRAMQLNEFDVDNLTAKEWSGRHFLPDGTAPQIVDGRYDLVGRAAICEHFDPAPLQEFDTWMAAMVVKRTVNSFVGDASLLNYNGTGLQLRPFVLTQNGTVKADGYVSSGSARGRSCPAGTLALNERAVFVVHGSPLGWRIYKNGNRVDNANVGTGNGLSFSNFSPWSSPTITLGGSTGCVHLERICIMGGLTVNQAVKIGIRLNLALQVY